MRSGEAGELVVGHLRNDRCRIIGVRLFRGSSPSNIYHLSYGEILASGSECVWGLAIVSVLPQP